MIARGRARVIGLDDNPRENDIRRRDIAMHQNMRKLCKEDEAEAEALLKNLNGLDSSVGRYYYFCPACLVIYLRMNVEQF